MRRLKACRNQARENLAPVARRGKTLRTLTSLALSSPQCILLFRLPFFLRVSLFSRLKQKKNARYCLARSYYLRTLFLLLLLKRWPPHYMIIWATRKSSRLQGKGSTFIFQLLWDLEYWSGPGNRTHDLPLRSQALSRSELILPR